MAFASISCHFNRRRRTLHGSASTYRRGVRPYIRGAKWFAVGALLALAVMVTMFAVSDGTDVDDPLFPTPAAFVAIMSWLGFLWCSGMAVAMLLFGAVRTRLDRTSRSRRG